MSGIDGVLERGFVMMWDAASLELLYHGTAPHLTLFGVHAKFFPFSVGCEKEDCSPQEDTQSLSTTAVPSLLAALLPLLLAGRSF